MLREQASRPKIEELVDSKTLHNFIYFWKPMSLEFILMAECRFLKNTSWHSKHYRASALYLYYSEIFLAN